jgi:1-acyl-sn-glycerol-3-phosphate acyltransferase
MLMRRGYRAAWCAANAIFSLLFTRKVRGRESIPRRGGFIIACNHISFWDPPVVGASVPREVYFLAKEELFRNRAFAWLITSLNAIPIRRGLVDHAGVKASLGAVQRGHGLMVFPEGGRVKEGELRPALPGVGLLSVKAGVPIVPTYIRGSDTIRKAIARIRNIDIVFGEPFSPPAEQKGRGRRDLYREVGEEVMNRIAELKSRVDAES